MPSECPHPSSLRRRWRSTLPALGCVVVLLLAAAAAAQSYIGAERCKTCHEFEFRVWAASPHARAHANLSAEQAKDPKCNVCHTMLPEQMDERFLGIQCERCHGAGRYYHRRYVMRDRELARLVGLVEPKEEHCRQCHTEGTPSIAPFDMAEMWRRMDHGKAARAAWEKSRGSAAKAEGGTSKGP